MDTNIWPLGKYFSQLTARYISVVSNRLSHLPIERYYIVIHVLATNKDVKTPADLVRVLEIDKVVVSRMVRYLVEKGMLIERRSRRDARVKFLELTEAGLAASHHIAQAYTEANEVCLTGMEPGRRADSLNMLNEMLLSMSHFSSEDISLNFKRIQKKK